VEIAFAGEVEVPSRVFAEGGEHVIQKANARFDLALPAPIERKGQRDVCFFGGAAE
jgi:hypothetical protein